MGQGNSKGMSSATASKTTRQVPSQTMDRITAQSMGGHIEHLADNISGYFPELGLVIQSRLEDPISRNFIYLVLFDNHLIYSKGTDYQDPERDYRMLLAIVARPERKRDAAVCSMNTMLEVLLAAKARSGDKPPVNFPTLVDAMHVKNLVYGHSGEDEVERDPEWTHRPLILVSLSKNHCLVSSLLDLSPTGTIPRHLALILGLGIMRAITELHRTGYVLRVVTPYCFAFPLPMNYLEISKAMVILDYSEARQLIAKMEATVSFVGSLRYASVKMHNNQMVGQADDLISLIYMVAEFISGKLPWRANKKEWQLMERKRMFHKTVEFKRLPKEIRTLYMKMSTMRPFEIIDHERIIKRFETAITKAGGMRRPMPAWIPSRK